MNARNQKRPHPLDVVFLTNFSEPCFRAIPSVAQMADDMQMRLTILHAYDPHKRVHGQAESVLRSFFPEADRYCNTRRLALPGTPFDALQRVAGEKEVHMVVCPGSDQLGLPRPGHRSLRGRILRDVGIPVWTIGRRTEPERLTRKIRNVGCWVEYDGPLTHLSFAAEYAAKIRATLHVFYCLPDIHEGMILPALPERPLHPNLANEFFANQVQHPHLDITVHVTTQRSPRIRGKLAGQHDIDLMFTPANMSPFAPWLFASLSGVDRFPCPTVCVASKSGRVWRPAAGSATTPTPTTVRLPQPAVLAFERR